MHAETVFSPGMKEEKPEKMENEAHEKVLFIVHCGEFEYIFKGKLSILQEGLN